MDDQRLFPIHEYLKKAGGDTLSDDDFNRCMLLFVSSIKNPSYIYTAFETLSTDIFKIYGRMYNYFIQDFLSTPDIVVFDEDHFDDLMVNKAKSYPDYKFIQSICSLDLVPPVTRFEVIKAFTDVLIPPVEDIGTILAALPRFSANLVEYGLVYVHTGINLSLMYTVQWYLDISLDRAAEQDAAGRSVRSTVNKAKTGDGTSPDDWNELFSTGDDLDMSDDTEEDSGYAS